MSQNLGDLKIKVILEILDADKNAKKFSATLTIADEEIKKVKKSTSEFSGSAVKLEFVLNTVKEFGYTLNSSISTIFNTKKKSNDAYQQFLSSNRQLAEQKRQNDEQNCHNA